MTEKFSIIIATYNRSLLLSKAVQSVVDQSYQDFQIVISDDASTDDTKQTVSGFSNQKIAYLCNKKNSGLSVTRNAAMKSARGEYLIFMDDDSILGERFLEILAETTSRHEGQAISPRILDPHTKEPFVDIFNNTKEIYLKYRDFNYFIGLAHIIPNEVVRRVGFYDENFGVGSKYRAAEESDYFFRLKRANVKVLYCPELIVYHRRDNEVSGNKVFNYSYGISAMLMKQVIFDFRRSHFYLAIILWRLTASLLRTLQYAFFPRSIESKNKIYRYKYFLKGSIIGIFDYLRFR